VLVFDWAQFRRSKGAVKLHLLLDHDGYLPNCAVVTEGKQHEVRVAKQLHFAPWTILAIDRRTGGRSRRFFGRSSKHNGSTPVPECWPWYG
jgi:hypothetical protein